MSLILTTVCCPVCRKAHHYEQSCQTPGCAELQNSYTYRLEELEGKIFIAQTYLDEGDTSEDWAAVVKEFTAQLSQFATQPSVSKKLAQ